jgi:hypothetical protein
VRREHWVLPSLATGPMNVLAYGHAGLPVVFIGAERASAWDFEQRGLLDAVAWLVDEGRLRLYAVDTYDAASWRNESLGREDRAARPPALRGLRAGRPRTGDPPRLRLARADPRDRAQPRARSRPSTCACGVPTSSPSRSG